MGSTESLAEAAARANADRVGAGSLGALRALRRLIAGERVRVLRELDDFLLRDIGASGDDIWRVHQLRNGERPTLLVG